MVGFGAKIQKSPKMVKNSKNAWNWYVHCVLHPTHFWPNWTLSICRPFYYQIEFLGAFVPLQSWLFKVICHFKKFRILGSSAVKVCNSSKKRSYFTTFFMHFRNVCFVPKLRLCMILGTIHRMYFWRENSNFLLEYFIRWWNCYVFRVFSAKIQSSS